MKEKLRRLLVRVLLLPIMPCFMWGPVVHPYINKRALETAKERVKRGSNKPANQLLVETLARHRDVYIYAGNSADAISSNHVLNGVYIYDYSHNNIPDCANGSPVFGYRLVHRAIENLKSAGSEGERMRRSRELALACGWLSHQLADWWPHYRSFGKDGKPTPDERVADEVETFSGYADSHQILGSNFYPDVLAATKDVDHAIVELFHDAYVLFTDDSRHFRPGAICALAPTSKQDNLITLVSEAFADSGEARIPPEHIPALIEDFNAVISGMHSMILLLKVLQPAFEPMVKQFCESGEKLRYVDSSVEYVVDNLFALSADEIERRATGNIPGIVGGINKLEIIKRRSGTRLMNLALRLAKALPPKIISTACKPNGDLSLALRTLGRLTLLRLDIGSDLVGVLKTLLLSAIESLGRRKEDIRSLACFVSALLSEAENPLEAARDKYCTNLRPLVRIGAPGDLRTGTREEDLLRTMYQEQRELRFRIVPAVKRQGGSDDYRIDRESLLVRINGYDHNDPRAPFVVKSEFQGDILVCVVSLKPGFQATDLHVFVNANDYRGEHSDYIDAQLHFS